MRADNLIYALVTAPQIQKAIRINLTLSSHTHVSDLDILNSAGRDLARKETTLKGANIQRK